MDEASERVRLVAYLVFAIVLAGLIAIAAVKVRRLFAGMPCVTASARC
jgi:hypothetical protein